MSIGYNRLIETEENKNYCINQNHLNEMFRIVAENINNQDSIDCFISKIDFNHSIRILINNIFDPNMPDKMKKKFINQLENNDVKIIDYSREKLIIEYTDKKIVIGNLCLLHKNFNKKDYKNNLYYRKDVYIPILLDKLRKLNHKSQIVTGYIDTELLDNKKLYSWLEIVNNKKDYVIDFINNIIIDKDSYYMLYNPKVLNSIKKDDVLNNETLSILINDLSIEYDEYLIFDKEFKEEIKKKKSYFTK